MVKQQFEYCSINKIFRAIVYLAFPTLYIHMCLITIQKANLVKSFHVSIIKRSTNSSTRVDNYLNKSDNIQAKSKPLKHFPRLTARYPLNSINLQVDGSGHDCPIQDTFINKYTYTKPCFLSTVETRLSIEEGSTGTLQCIIYNVNFSTIVISWWRVGQMREITLGLATSDPRYSIPRLSYQDWSLQISRARVEDSGTYVCQINLEQTLEKFYQFTVKPKPSLMNYPPATEHEFVEDEAIQKNFNLRNGIRIEGKSEGIAGIPLTLVCSAFLPNGATSVRLVWSHETEHYHAFSNPSSSSPGFILRDPKSRNLFNGSYSQPYIKKKVSQYVQISEQRYGNRTLHSQLTFRPLLMEHAGIWKCTKLVHPHRTVLEETQVMVYVKAKTLPSQMRQETRNSRASANYAATQQFNRQVVLIFGMGLICILIHS